MTESDKKYWEKRQEQKFLAGEKKIEDYYKGLQRAFEKARQDIHSIINDFYWRYAQENQFTFASAQIKLNKEELVGLNEFIKLVEENMGKYNLKVTNMSLRARITRYQALEKQIDATLQQLYAIEYQHKGEELLKDLYEDSYYRTWRNIDQYTGFHAEFAQVNHLAVEELIKYPFNGANFSTRLWKQKDAVMQQLNESITTMLIQGKNPNTLSKDFAKKFDTKEFEARRLLHTEGTFIMEQGTLAAYKEDGIEKYEILATLDTRTSEICQHQDGKVYDVDKAVVGVNLSPFHPFCRTTTTPWYDDMEVTTRSARASNGKAIKVPSSMTYGEWKKEYIDE